MNWWLPHNFAQKHKNLKQRQRVIRALRDYFAGQDFDEVETNILQVCPVMDTHIHAFGTELRGVDRQPKAQLYLHTSPEFAMKKLMVAGVERLYQICHVFRNCEGSSRHSPEFTMLEWYRAGADYTDIMVDCEGLLRHVAKNCGITEFKYKESACDPFADFERLSVCAAFDHYAGIDLSAHLEDRESFRKAVSALGLHTAEDDGWDDLFFRVMDAKIGPYLGMDRPTFLYDYPVSMASLSRRKKEDPRFAERFELYVCGIELANAFSELTDADEQRKRFTEEMDQKEKLYGEHYPADEDFLHALEYGLSESGGIALGVDRLVMLVCGEENIRGILWEEMGGS